MKLIVISFILVVTNLALAEVSYSSLEKLRKHTIAVRVALDFPKDKSILKCHIPIERFAEIGSNLQIATDSEKSNWQNLKLSPSDLNWLETKINHCVMRASCSIYEELLTSTSTDESLKEKLQILKTNLIEKNKQLNSKKYLEASKKIKNLCTYLKN